MFYIKIIYFPNENLKLPPVNKEPFSVDVLALLPNNPPVVG